MVIELRKKTVKVEEKLKMFDEENLEMQKRQRTVTPKGESKVKKKRNDHNYRQLERVENLLRKKPKMQEMMEKCNFQNGKIGRAHV